MNNNDATSAIAGVFVLLYVVFLLAAIGFGIYMYMRIARKAGYPPTYGLLMFIPVANIVFAIMYVFTKWPIEAEVEALRAQVAAQGGGWSAAGIQPPPAPWPAQPRI